MVRKLLDIRAVLIGLGIFIGVCLVGLGELFSGSLVMLEPPHIEGGMEVTMQNMINDMKRDGELAFRPLPPDEEPARNEWGIREDLIESGAPWLR